MSSSGKVTPTPDPGVPVGSTVRVTVRPTVAPDLVNFRVSNPVTYLKLWWKKVIANEGITIRIKPITTILLAALIIGGSYSLGIITYALQQVPGLSRFIPTPSPQAVVAKDTAYAGILRKSGSNFYLQTGAGQAVNLIIPNNINLNAFIGKRIFATGTYNTITGYLTVRDAMNLEVLPVNPVPIPTTAPTPIPTPAPTASPQPSDGGSVSSPY